MKNTKICKLAFLSPLPTLKWLDSSKPLFTVTLSAVSSVHSQDEYLEKFFVSASSLSSNDKKNPPVNEQTLIKVIEKFEFFIKINRLFDNLEKLI